MNVKRRRVCRERCDSFGILLAVLMILCVPSAAATVFARDCTISAPGETGECALVLDEVPSGLSEFEIMVAIEDASIGTISSVQFPASPG